MADDSLVFDDCSIEWTSIDTSGFKIGICPGCSEYRHIVASCATVWKNGRVFGHVRAEICEECADETVRDFSLNRIGRYSVKREAADG